MFRFQCAKCFIPDLLQELELSVQVATLSPSAAPSYATSPPCLTDIFTGLPLPLAHTELVAVCLVTEAFTHSPSRPLTHPAMCQATECPQCHKTTWKGQWPQAHDDSMYLRSVVSELNSLMHGQLLRSCLFVEVVVVTSTLRSPQCRSISAVSTKRRHSSNTMQRKQAIRAHQLSNNMQQPVITPRALSTSSTTALHRNYHWSRLVPQLLHRCTHTISIERVIEAENM